MKFISGLLNIFHRKNLKEIFTPNTIAKLAYVWGVKRSGFSEERENVGKVVCFIGSYEREGERGK